MSDMQAKRVTTNPHKKNIHRATHTQIQIINTTKQESTNT